MGENSPSTCAASNSRASEPMYSLCGPSKTRFRISLFGPRRSTGMNVVMGTEGRAGESFSFAVLLGG